jgi:hypothetical protein
MGVTKKTITEGNGVDKAKKGDTITMEYTGNLYDSNADNGKGKQSVRRTRAVVIPLAYAAVQIRFLSWSWRLPDKDRRWSGD